MKIYNISSYFGIDVVELPAECFEDNAWGDIIYKDKLIRLNESLPEDLKRQTLIHELVHAIIFYMGYSETMTKEDMCNFVSSHLDTIHNVVNEYYEVKE